jgi:hypothetical protein
MPPFRLLAVVATCAALAASCTEAADPPAPRASAATQDPRPAPVVLDVRVAKVNAAALKGRPSRRPLRVPAEEIRQTITEMYLGGFVDPARWAGDFTGVVEAFAPKVRDRARQDLAQLSLGRAARSLTEVRPIRSRIVIEFLTDAQQRPVAALTDMEFSGTGVGDGFEIPIRHDGDFVLRPFGGRWLITGYEVDGRIG